MARRLTDITATAKANLMRPALTALYEVELGIPGPLRIANNKQEKLQLLCSEVSLPGSQLATTEITNDFTGVTERHAYRRIFDDRIDLNFYVDAEDYLPIKFFEKWIAFIMNSENDERDLAAANYAYRARYPNEYIADQGLMIKKFEKDTSQLLEYHFVRSWPISITSMPVSYDSSNLLKCNVSMTYTRYIVKDLGRIGGSGWGSLFDPFVQSLFNSGGVSDAVSNFAGNTVKNIVKDLF